MSEISKNPSDDLASQLRKESILNSLLIGKLYKYKRKIKKRIKKEEEGKTETTGKVNAGMKTG